MHMKKRLLALVICITLMLSACGKETSAPADNKTEKETTVSNAANKTEDSSANLKDSSAKSGDSFADMEDSSTKSGDSSADSGYSESGDENHGEAAGEGSVEIQRVGSGAKSGTNWIYKLVDISNIDDGYSYGADDVHSPYLYVTRNKKGETMVSGIFWTAGTDYIGTQLYDLGKDFMSGMVEFYAYDGEGNLGEFTQMYVSISGDTATATDENLRMKFSFVLDETFDF